MATESNAVVSVSTQPNSECKHDSVVKKTPSFDSDVLEKSTKKTALNCMPSDEALRWLERAFVTVVIVSIVVLLSLPSVIFFVSYHRCTSKDVREVSCMSRKYGSTFYVGMLYSKFS